MFAILMRLSAVALLSLGVAWPQRAAAEIESYLLFDMADGTILAEHRPTALWFPASITKLMTAYVTFDQIREGKLKLTSPIVISPQAFHQPPSRMGFPIGTTITVETALRIILTKSANDVSVALAEGVGGTQQGFIDLMNETTEKLGMADSHYDNPHGLPNTKQITTARDIAVLMMALDRDFPEYRDFFSMSGVQLGKRRLKNHNALIRRFRGADGYKTGFICASGFNIAAAATRNSHRLGAVVLGALTSQERNHRTAELLSKGFDALDSGGLVALDGFDPDVREGVRAGPVFSPSDEEPDARLAFAPVTGTRPDYGTVVDLPRSEDAAAEDRLPRVCVRPRPKTRYSNGFVANKATHEAQRAAMRDYRRAIRDREAARKAQLAAPLAGPLRASRAALDTTPLPTESQRIPLSQVSRELADLELRPDDWSTLRPLAAPPRRPTVVLAHAGAVWSRDTATDLAPEGWTPAPLAAPWRHPLADTPERGEPVPDEPLAQPLSYMDPAVSIAAIPIRIGGADEARPSPLSGPVVGGGPPPRPLAKPLHEEPVEAVDPESVENYAAEVREEVIEQGAETGPPAPKAASVPDA